MTTFPDYARPPVVETILGVQFELLAGWGNARLGAFWKSLPEGEWPTTHDAPPLQPAFEQFDPVRSWGAEVERIRSQGVTSRLQIRNRDQDRMIQVQNGRLHFNWLRREGVEYPRYDRVRDGFARTLDQFLRFCEAEGLPGFSPNQWEVTYLNHIPQGTVWSEPGDWTFFRPLTGRPTIENVALEESFSGEWHFVIPPQQGRLHVHWRHARGVGRPPAPSELVELTLTARGPIPDGDADADRVLAGLDLGRKTIVCAFRDLMSNEANSHWGLKP